MIIHYKRIEHERVEDAPFMGALISSIDCKFNCNECFNQHLKNDPTLEKDSQDIIKEIKSNPFNKGIILSGLEWTLQPEEMKELITLSLKNKLKVILYTGNDEITFKNKFKDIYELPIYIKFGQYKKELTTEKNEQYFVKLATLNQYIRKD